MAHPPTQRDQDPKAEVEKYRKALAQDPDSRLFAALADALRRAGDVKAAIAVAEQGIKKHPKYLSGIMVLAQAYFADARLDDALELFKKVIKLNPENLMAHRAMAEIYDRIGDHDQALKAYRAITILDHTDKRAMERLQILEATMPRKPRAAPAEPDPAPGKARTPAPAEAAAPPAPEPAPTPEPFPKMPDDLAAPGQGPEAPDQHGDQEITSPGAAPPEGAVAPAAPDEDTVVIPPPVKRAPAPPAAPAEDSVNDKLPRAGKPGPEPETAPAPAAAGPAPAAADKKGMSEEEKLDLFFSGKNLSRLGIAAEAEGFEVMGARDALRSPRAAVKPAPAPDAPPAAAPLIEDVKITRSAMAKVFWNQGFRQKALAVMAGEVCEKPNDPDLRAEFMAACQAMGQEQGKLIAEAAHKSGAGQDDKKAGPAKEREAPEPAPAPAGPEEDATAEVKAPDKPPAPDKPQAPDRPPAQPKQTAPAKQPGPDLDLEWFLPPVSHPAAAMKADAAPAARPRAAEGGDGGTAKDAPEPEKAAPTPGPVRVQALRKYLDKIKGGKENKP